MACLLTLTIIMRFISARFQGRSLTFAQGHSGISSVTRGLISQIENLDKTLPGLAYGVHCFIKKHSMDFFRSLQHQEEALTQPVSTNPMLPS